MKLLRRLSLIGAGSLTLLLSPFVLGNLHPWGTHNGLAGLQWLVWCTPRWFCLALALAAGLRTGQFDWVSTRTSGRWLVVASAHLISGLASLFCLVEMSETHPPVPLWLWALAALISLVVPTVILTFLAVPRPASGESQAPPPLWRGLLTACALAGIATGSIILWREHLDTLEVRRQEAVRKAEYRAREQTGLAQLAQLPADAPLERWLPFTQVPEVSGRARDAISARPRLTQELASALRSNDATTRALTLDYLCLGGGVRPPLPDELIAPVCEALQAMAASQRAQAETQANLPAIAFDEPCMTMLILPKRFPGHEADFVGPVRALRATLDREPKDAEPTIGQQELDSWLQSHDPGGPR